jgi:hypothetical protein
MLSRSLARKGLPDLYELNYQAFFETSQSYWLPMTKKIEGVCVEGDFSYIAYYSEDDINRACKLPESWIDGANREYAYYSNAG